MKIRWSSGKKSRIARRTLFAGIGFISILLAVGILFSLLPLNSNVASAVINKVSYSGAPVTESPSLYANAQPSLSPLIRIRTTNAQRLSAARIAASGTKASLVAATGAGMRIAALTPGGTPDYFGTIPNYANSPAPAVDSNGTVSGGIRKFVDSLPGLGPAGANNIGQYIPIAVADTTTYNGSDYYEIGLVDYTEKMHSDLNATKLRGYVQLSTTNVPGAHIPLKYINGTGILNASGDQVYAVDNPHYLGPVIIAQKDKPVRVKFTNFLATGTDGNLFIPVDTTIVGAGDGPSGCTLDANGIVVMGTCQQYSQNRGTIHLHGGNTPWISDGTQDQWTTPAGENTSYPRGVSTKYVPDMDGGTEPAGTMTFYYTNQQSARLMFYHDHAYGLTRLTVYAGVAAAYLETDQVEQDLISGTNLSGANPDNLQVLPDVGIPLVIQDKTFLPDNLKVAAQDPTWPFTLNSSRSDLWFPHVYMPAENQSGSINPMGRWDYGPWIDQPVNATNGPVPNPLSGTAPQEGSLNPGTPNPSIVPEAFVDTSVVNGNVYPYLQLGQKAYRFRILNAANDRTFNLQLYYASTAGPFVKISGGGDNAKGASARAMVNATGGITGISVTSGGAGYTERPEVLIFDAPGHTHDGSDAEATATIDVANGTVTDITVTNGGSGYSVPTMCKGAAVTNHSLCTEISMVPAVPGAAQFPADWNTTTGNAENPYAILDGRPEGVPDPNSTGPSMIQIGTEGGFLPAPVTIPNRPIGYDYNNSANGVLNVREKALNLAGAERADVIVDFSGVPDNSTLILYSDSPIPVTGADSRYDYFTNDPDNTIIGGASSTIPGYGPNTRTIMQFRVNASIGTAPAFNMTNLTEALPVAYAQSQGRPIVPESAYNAAFNTSYIDNYIGLNDTSITFTPEGSAANITMNLMPKSINDGFDPIFGGLMTVLGVEIPQARFAIPYNNFDPPTEIIRNSNAAVPIGTLGDGTQIWRIYHNSVDTHPMHWHMFNVQVINRISQLDGTIKPPDPNELGWRETLRVNPLEDAIIALRPIKPNVPWDLPNNIRPIDVTSPIGAKNPTPFENIDPANQTANVTNHLVNFGEEYVWHCHILGHEESMIMRPMAILVTPNAPSNLAATRITTGVALNWIDNSTNEINFIVQRATNASGPWTTVATVQSTTGPGKGTTVMYNDTVTGNNTIYYYQVIATNVVGDTTVYAAPAAGYPNMVANSISSNTASASVAGTDTVGIYRSGAFDLRNSNSAGNADLAFIYGLASDTPLAGDWNGDGTDTVGVYRNGAFYLRNNNSAGNADLAFVYGVAGDTPLAGDWNGDGTDTVGVYRNGTFYLRNNNSAGNADLAFVYGVAGDIPLVGDWNGDGTDTVGVYRNGAFYLRNSNSAGNADNAFIYGISGDTPLAGDWTGSGIDTVGIYRAGAFYLRNSNSAGNADNAFIYGISTDTPLTGDWNGT
ncbi:MAG: multicopper oxidase domain-containing protein [Candidatus Methanoperedens sp.]|nr:multicopper oxidase domain-containing protein [Candidatus Methanoperedens sp.]